MAKVFICSSSRDRGLVEAVVSDIENWGFAVWMDRREITSGSSWRAQIIEAIEECDRFLLFISPNSMDSRSVHEEVQLAHENRKPIIGLRLENANIAPEVRYQLAGIQQIQYSDPDWRSKLAAALGKAARSPSPEETSKPSQGETGN